MYSNNLSTIIYESSMFVSRLDLTRHSVPCAIAAATAGTGAVATDIEELNAADGTESSSSDGT